MRMLPFILFASAIAPPAAAQPPISGLGNAPGSDNAFMRRWLGAGDRPDRVHADRRRAELAGQLGQVDRRIRRQRENGEISREEARQLRREARRIAILYVHYDNDGLSDSEDAELQSRILALNSIAIPTRQPRSRAGR